MPLYEYECANGHRFERLSKPVDSDEVIDFCDECGEAATRVLSAHAGMNRQWGLWRGQVGRMPNRK